MNTEEIKARNVFLLLGKVCAVIADAKPYDAHIYRRMANEPYHCEGFPASRMIVSLIADHIGLFRNNDDLMIDTLRLLDSDYRLPLMPTNDGEPDNEPESDNETGDGVGEPNGET